MKLGLTIEDAKAAQLAMERSVYQAIWTFEQATGLKVESVHMLRTENIGGRTHTAHVECEVRL